MALNASSVLSDFSIAYLFLSNFSYFTLFLGAFTTFASVDVIGPEAGLYAKIHAVGAVIQSLL